MSQSNNEFKCLHTRIQASRDVAHFEIPTFKFPWKKGEAKINVFSTLLISIQMPHTTNVPNTIFVAYIRGCIISIIQKSKNTNWVFKLSPAKFRSHFKACLWRGMYDKARTAFPPVTDLLICWLSLSLSWRLVLQLIKSSKVQSEMYKHGMRECIKYRVGIKRNG